MTRKDYELLAEAIKETWVDNEVDKTRIAAAIARALFKENNRFDFDKFMEAAAL